MHNIFNPRWIIIINTIPSIILFVIYLGAYQIIKTLLPTESQLLWLRYGIALLSLTTINLVYAIILIITKRSIHTLYGFLILLLYIPLLYAYITHAEDIIPWDIPRWMIPENMGLYVGTFLMPSLAMALFILVVGFTSKYDKPGVNFAVAILIPVSWYVFFQVVLPFWQMVDSPFWGHLFTVFIIIGTLLFLFFISRGAYIISLKKSERWKYYQLSMKITLALVFPLLGLALSEGSFFFFAPNIFGDFTHPWFFIIAILNGIFVVLPNFNRPLYRLILFLARSITFTYILYFFLVFLPYLPLSVLAIILFGLGFLMLTPLILMVLQSKMMVDDFTYLRQYYAKSVLIPLLLVGVILLPGIITLSYLQDKKVLHRALSYVYEPDYQSNTAQFVYTKTLQRLLNKVRYHKNGSFGMLGGEQQPFLSAYYNWLVLNNLTLSNNKLNDLEKIFLGKKTDHQEVRQNISNNINVTNVKTKSDYDTTQQVWRSWIDLEITNFDTINWQNEFATTFELPEGAWISDYYLWVDDVKKPGILAEKKTATWIYNQIVNTRKDPGILYYTSGNKIAFRIFPFLRKETRKTGFELLHKEPIQLNIDQHILSLGNNSVPLLSKILTSADQNVIYVPAQVKKRLPLVKRTPYFHFVIDGSVHNKNYTAESVEKIDDLLNKKQLYVNNSKFTIANAFTKTFDYSVDWQKEIVQHHYTGGFYLERAIKEILFKQYEEQSKYYPIIIIVTNDFTNAILPTDFADFDITFPESELFFELEKSGILIAHSLISNCKEVLNSAQLGFDYQVFAYPDVKSPITYLPINDQPNIIITSTQLFRITAKLPAKSWDSAMLLHSKWLIHQLYPRESDRVWLDLVKGSFAAQIMTPVTSFIVVENEAQEAALYAKQAKVLAAKHLLDLGENAEEMSEPDLIFLLGLLLPILYFFRKRII